MSTPIDHHYIPQFYLSRWVKTGSKLCRFQLVHGGKLEAKRKSPKTTAYEPNLYGDLETTMMSTLDGQASIALKNLLESNASSEIPEATKRNWASFIVSQLTRTPEDIEQLKLNTKHYISELITDIQNNPSKHKDKKGDLEEFLAFRDTTFSDEKMASRVMPTIIGHNAITEDIYSMEWCVIDVSKEHFSLLTSDRPVSLSYRGSKSEIEITMPLSPQHLLLATNSSKNLERMRSRGKRHLVRVSNLESTRKAAQYVYAEDDEMHDFVRRHISAGRTFSLNELVAKTRGFPLAREEP